MSKPLVIRNLRQLVSVNGAYSSPLGIIEHGAMICDDKILWVGHEADLPSFDTSSYELIDGGGGVLTPGLVDSHTHLLYAGSREADFVKRVSGMTFREINESGGGIISTVKATRRATADELLDIGRARLDSFLAQGTTTVEIKSGYGLTTSDEIKMLEVISELDRSHVVDVVPTFMAAHAIPPEYGGRRGEYVRLIVEEMIPEVARRRLATFCDVFCDDLAFSVTETEAILSAGKRHGLQAKVHAEQFSHSRGTAVAVAFTACSVDHLDYISPDLERELASSKVVAVLTPGVNLFLGLQHLPPARRLIDAGIEIALATDYSPGACMTESLPLIMTLAAVQMGMRPDEALRGVTICAARAVGRETTIGSIAPGKQADLVIWSVPNYEHLVYHFGVNHVRTVIKDGRIVHTAMPSTACLAAPSSLLETRMRVS